MNKAIIVEVNHRHLIVLAEGGEFKKIKNTNPSHQIGQEIILSSRDKKGFMVLDLLNWKTGTAVMAAFVLLFFQVLSPIFGQDVYAYVGMDMDPSLELKINEKMQVLDIQAYNEEGKKVLHHLEDWQEKDIEKVTSLIFETCESLGFLEDDQKEEVLITTTLSEEIPNKKQQVIKKRVTEVIQKAAQKKSVQMTSIVLDAKERKKAKKMKVSPGHYAIYQAAEKSGIKIQPKDLTGKTLEEISQKVGPINQLLDQKTEEKTVQAQEKPNHVYEPPLPLLDKKEEDEFSNTTSINEEDQNNIPKQEIPQPMSNKKEAVKVKKEQPKAKNEPETKPELVAVRPIKDDKKQSKEDKTTKASPSMTDQTSKPDLSDSEPKQPETVTTVSDKTEQQEKDQSDSLITINIQLLIDGKMVSVQVKASPDTLEKEVLKQALAIINNHSLTADKLRTNQLNLEPLTNLESQITISPLNLSTEKTENFESLQTQQVS